MNYLATAFAFCALLLGQTVNAIAQKAALLKKCEATFGKAVDTDLNLFLLDNNFVIRVEFTKKGKLRQIAAEPKYFLSGTHPEWVEPDERPLLLNKTPQALVSLIDSVASLGTFETSYGSPWITNSTRYRHECYEKAVVTFGDHWDWHGNPNEDPKVRFLRVDYNSKCKGG